MTNDTNNANDIFVYDQTEGVMERVSVAGDGSEGDSNSEGSPKISSDGRYVAFVSDATNLVPGDTNNALDIFVHDRLMGSTDSAGTAGFGVLPDTVVKFRVTYNGGSYDTQASSTHKIQAVSTVPLTVTLTADSSPLANQTVQLRRANGTLVLNQTTDASGVTVFEVLPGTEYIVRSTYNGVQWNSPLTQAGSSINHNF